MTDQDENVKVCGLKVGMLVRVSWGIPLVVWKTIEDWAWNSTIVKLTRKHTYPARD